MRDKAFYEEKARTVAALAHPVRLAILDRLSEGPLSTGSLVEELELPQPLVSQHLAVLRQAGVVAREREGARQVYRLADPKIAAACGLMGEIVTRLVEAERERLRPLAQAPRAR